MAAVAIGLGGGCGTKDTLAVIPCNLQEHCTPHGLYCDLQVGQCALCTNDGGNCMPPASGGSAGNSGQGGTGSGNGGSSPSDGGSNPSGGDAGNGSGGASGGASGGNGSGGEAGSGGTTGGSAGDGAGGSAGGPACSPVTGAAQDLVIYGASTTCNDRLDAPRTGHWFAFNDGFGLQNPSSDQAHNGVSGGRAGGADCMMRTQGAGFTDWGGSVKFWINASGGQICTYDATNYQGIRFYIRGTTTGTSGAAFVPADNTVRVNIPTQSTSSSAQGGTCVPAELDCDDSYGKWCAVGVDWTLCELAFASITQVGWGTVALFTKSEILGLQIQASRLATAASASWDLYIDDVTFY